MYPNLIMNSAVITDIQSASEPASQSGWVSQPKLRPTLHLLEGDNTAVWTARPPCRCKHVGRAGQGALLSFVCARGSPPVKGWRGRCNTPRRTDVPANTLTFPPPHLSRRIVRFRARGVHVCRGRLYLRVERWSRRRLCYPTSLHCISYVMGTRHTTLCKRCSLGDVFAETMQVEL